MNIQRTVVVATHNAHKLAEIRAILDIPSWKFVSLDELGIYEEPPEDAQTFVGNARIKARFAHKKTGFAALADDSGLVVSALGGAPGVYSSRYAGEGVSDDSNNAKLLYEMKDLCGAARNARFVCALVFIDESGQELSQEGELTGRIGYELKGSGGFGYDPLFCLEVFAYEQTVAELPVEEKNALSHRHQALEALRATLALPAPASARAEAKRPIVAFDFDGTLLDASSPVRLIMRLNSGGIMPKRAIAKTILWGARYKLGNELDQSVPRRYVFSSFKNFSARDANAIMRDLYHEELRPLLRPEALEALEAHRTAGHELIVVSASFEPIVKTLCEDLRIPHYICTQMEIVGGSYSGETVGDPPEGMQKLIQLRAWANGEFGVGNWELTHAYGDHFSDVPLLETAQNPVAVDPDRRLDAIAKERGWAIRDWPLK